MPKSKITMLEEKIKKKDLIKEINDILNNSNKYVHPLEVDLDYPEDIHDLHNDYPLAPKRLIFV